MCFIMANNLSSSTNKYNNISKYDNNNKAKDLFSIDFNTLTIWKEARLLHMHRFRDNNNMDHFISQILE